MPQDSIIHDVSPEGQKLLDKAKIAADEIAHGQFSDVHQEVTDQAQNLMKNLQSDEPEKNEAAKAEIIEKLKLYWQGTGSGTAGGIITRLQGMGIDLDPYFEKASLEVIHDSEIWMNDEFFKDYCERYGIEMPEGGSIGFRDSEGNPQIFINGQDYYGKRFGIDYSDCGEIETQYWVWKLYLNRNPMGKEDPNLHKKSLQKAAEFAHSKGWLGKYLEFKKQEIANGNFSPRRKDQLNEDFRMLCEFAFDLGEENLLTIREKYSQNGLWSKLPFAHLSGIASNFGLINLKNKGLMSIPIDLDNIKHEDLVFRKEEGSRDTKIEAEEYLEQMKTWPTWNPEGRQEIVQKPSGRWMIYQVIDPPLDESYFQEIKSKYPGYITSLFLLDEVGLNYTHHVRIDQDHPDSIKGRYVIDKKNNAVIVLVEMAEGNPLNSLLVPRLLKTRPYLEDKSREYWGGFMNELAKRGFHDYEVNQDTMLFVHVQPPKQTYNKFSGEYQGLI